MERDVYVLLRRGKVIAVLGKLPPVGVTDCTVERWTVEFPDEDRPIGFDTNGDGRPG